MDALFIDIHTHHPVSERDVISVPSIFLQDIRKGQDLPVAFTAGIHPWHAEKYDLGEIDSLLGTLNEFPGFIAVGEVGLDKKCGADINKQRLIFQYQLNFATKHNLPLIIHNVRAWNEMMGYSKGDHPPFIFHGYMGNIEITRQLILQNCYFSFGNAITKENNSIKGVLKTIPLDRLFLETDDDQIDIRDIYAEASAILDLPVKELQSSIFSNYIKVFRRPKLLS